MIFAEMEYQGDYGAMHEELRTFLEAHFPNIQQGLQGDSWFWIFESKEKVAIDTFSSMRHQIKAERPGQHVQSVINTLQLKYKLKVYDRPEFEGHDGAGLFNGVRHEFDKKTGG